MHGQKFANTGTTQRRAIIAVVILFVLAIVIGIPLIVNDQLRYDLTMRTGTIPGQDVEQIAEGDDGLQLMVVPLDHNIQGVPTPWLFKAQFIAWPTDEGMDLENLQSGDRAIVPVESIEFTSANGDGSLMLIRGNHAESGEPAAFTIAPESMEVNQLESADAVPDVAADWETSSWEKQGKRCERPSPSQRFVACFVNADLASYFAGDWELNILTWGDYTTMYPVFRGMGFLPIVGFANDDTEVYFQNENGLWRADVPEEALIEQRSASPQASPAP